MHFVTVSGRDAASRRKRSVITAVTLASSPSPFCPADAEKAAIDAWITAQGLNKYGDPQGTVYAGGNPLFDMATGSMGDKYERIAARHPDRPWRRLAGSSTGFGGSSS